MRRWAQIINSTVTNVVVQPAAPTLPGTWIDVTGSEVGIGMVDLGGGVYGFPPATPDLRITRLAFGRRFTTAERIAVEMAAIDNPAATTPARQAAAAIRVYLADVQAAQWIDLSRADTRAGVQSLESATIIAAGRAAAILDAPVQDGERP